MNKRARLTRRILREHRQDWPWHYSAGTEKGTHWTCPHCTRWARDAFPIGGSVAYR